MLLQKINDLGVLGWLMAWVFFSLIALLVNYFFWEGAGKDE